MPRNFSRTSSHHAAIGYQLRHSVEPFVDRRQIHERIGHPIGQQARAHRRLRAIQNREQRALAAALTHCLRDFQAAARRFVDLQRRTCLARQQAINMRQRRFLRLGEIFENGAGGAQRRDITRRVETKAFQRRGAEVFR